MIFKGQISDLAPYSEGRVFFSTTTDRTLLKLRRGVLTDTGKGMQGENWWVTVSTFGLIKFACLVS